LQWSSSISFHSLSSSHALLISPNHAMQYLLFSLFFSLPLSWHFHFLHVNQHFTHHLRKPKRCNLLCLIFPCDSFNYFLTGTPIFPYHSSNMEGIFISLWDGICIRITSFSLVSYYLNSKSKCGANYSTNKSNCLLFSLSLHMFQLHTS